MKKKIFAAFVAVLFVGPAVSWAEVGKERVLDVQVEGTQTIASETILAKVQTKPGMTYNEAIISEDIRRIYSLGFFTHVQADLEELDEGIRMIFVVKEKPQIILIKVEGHKKFSEKKILEWLEIPEGALHDARKVKEGIEKIKAEYNRKGYSESEIVSRVETDEFNNTAELYVLIDEGAKIRIKDVLVEGNEAFSDSKVRKLVKSRRKWWFLKGTYDAKVLEEDLDRVRAYYRKNGYADVSVASRVYRAPDGKGLYVHLTVDEGTQYRVGEVLLQGQSIFSKEELLALVTMGPGTVFNGEDLREDMRLLKQYYGDKGFIHANVTPDPQLDEANKRVTLTYLIEEGQRVYVRRIDVQGNLKTKDEVVRRELKVVPGEVFDGAEIRKSVERLNNLGYFEEVTVDTQPTDDPRYEDLIVDVKSAKTGSFSIGGGFSSVDKLVGLLEVEQRNFDLFNFPNFTGAGQDLRFRAEMGASRKNFNLAFTEPWMLGKPISFGVDAYNRVREQDRNSGYGYEEERRGGGLRLGKRFGDYLGANVGYQYFRTEISDVSTEASAALQAEEGTSNTSIVNTSISYDRRDNRFDPMSGFYAFSSFDIAGGLLGADEDFGRVQAGMSHYWQQSERFVLETRTRAGIVEAYDHADVPIFERFFGGGASTIRGFEERNVGPTDATSNDPTGGEATFMASVEEVITLVNDERGRPMIRGALFLDAGNVWEHTHDFGRSLKYSMGIGARVKTPFGPVKLDLGYPISQIENEKRKARFHFNMSRSF